MERWKAKIRKSEGLSIGKVPYFEKGFCNNCGIVEAENTDNDHQD